jgi:mRNA interferase RelE/StbE
MLLIDYSNDAAKFLLKLEAKQHKQINSKIIALAKDPRPVDSIDMSGDGLFRADIGEYRIVYKFDKTILQVFIIGKRNDDDVYKKLDRK